MIYQLVSHDRVLNYLLCGWHIVQPDLGAYHSQFGVLMAWLCKCKTVWPIQD